MASPSQRLGKYEIFDKIGRGAFATVYRALDTTLDREVALKILHPPLLTDPSFIERFKREARALAKLTHPHIVTVFEIGEAEGRVYIAMELARGPDLGKAIAERGCFSWEQTLVLLRPMCEALDHAHGRDVVHRDLKPSNVLLDRERSALLTDFGFARLMGESSVSLSLSGGILGTPAYIAPEVWELDIAGPAADVYALGCIVHEMLTGDVLFAGKTPMQAMRAHDRGPRFPQAWPEDVPEGMQPVLRKALARDPTARYPSAMALWHALNDSEAQAQAEREAAELEALTAQWQAETEVAMQAGEWRAAKMAVGRWLAVAPDDPRAQTARQEIEWHLPKPEPGVPDAESILCLNCGHRNGPGASMCRTCGARLGDTATEARPSSARPSDRAGAGEWLRKIPGWAWAMGGLGLVGLMVAAVASAGLFGSRAGPTETRRPASGLAAVPTETGQPTSGFTPVATETRRPTSGFTPVPTETRRPVPTSGAASSPTDKPTPLPVTSTPRPRQADTPTPPGPSSGDTWIRPADGATMVYVPAGEFEMGSTGGYSNEQPVHTVAVDAFWIDRTEVTNAQYNICVMDGNCEESRYATDPDYNGEDYPVVGVDWHDAAAYCEWAGARLATEAEWEYAARGPEGNTYPWGDESHTCQLAQNQRCEGATLPVGSFPNGASWCGALDMAGNVEEWVADWYGGYSSGRQTNPTGPSTGTLRVLRGGSWSQFAVNIRGASRDDGFPNGWSDNVGFRCVRDSN